jgi:hypothetical protein
MYATPPAKRETVSPEEVEAVIETAEEWFQAMQNGTANLRLPDPSYRRFTQQECDEFIEWLDDYFTHQVEDYGSYFIPRGCLYPADWKRIEGGSREAFLQDLKKALAKFGNEE